MFDNKGARFALNIKDLSEGWFLEIKVKYLLRALFNLI